MKKIPLRPENDDIYRIPDIDKDCLTYYVLFGVPTTNAFARFHPEYVDPVTGKLIKSGHSPCRQFFNFAIHKEYIEAYSATLRGLFVEKKEKTTNVSSLSNNSKEKALKDFTDKVFSALANADAGDLAELKDVADLGKTVKIFRDDEEVIEPPRRYLPEMCYTMCRYRKFCEDAIEKGDIVDCCKYCNALKYAEERGFEYDPTKLLNLPDNEEDKQVPKIL